MLKLLFLVACLEATFAAPLFDFAGDALLSGTDEGCTLINFSGSFPYHGSNYNKAHPSVNGVVGLTKCIDQFRSFKFPSSVNGASIAPYYGDGDTTCAGCGGVYTRVREGPSPIDTFGGITAVEYFQVTWSDVAYFRERTDRLNSFQMITATDRSKTITCFIYPNDVESGNPNGGLDWTTGGASGGLGGTEAQVGLDSGNKVDALHMIESQEEAVRSLDGIPDGAPPATSIGLQEGLYCFRVDTTFEPICPVGTDINGGSCTCAPCNQQITCGVYNLEVDQNCEVVIGDFTPNIQSDCTDQVYTQEPQSGETRTVGFFTTTETVTNECSQSNSCRGMLDIFDRINPTLLCPSEATIATDAGICTSSQDVSILYSVTDNCAVDSTSNDAPPSLPLGSNTVNVVARDESGNTNSCSFNVIVADSESPSIQCPTEATAFTTDPGTCASTQDISTLYSATDNCAIDSTSNDAPPTLPQGSSSVNAMARDTSGNTNSCSFNVFVVDSESPSIQCPSEAATIATDPESCSSTQDVSTLYSVTDNCAVSFTGNDAPPTLPQGSSSVNVFARDVSGNTNSCSFNVIVADSESPSIQCPTEATTFTTDPGTCASIQDISTLYSATDNCAIDSTSNDAPPTLPQGSSSVNAMARDTSGNTDSCSFNVIVADSESPSIQCPSEAATIATDAGSCSSTQDVSTLYSATDNCAIDSTSNDAPPTLPQGSSSVNVIARDASGNTNSCSFNVIVADSESPSIQCPSEAATIATDAGSCSSTQDVSALYSVTDNCAIDSTSNDAPPTLPRGSSSVNVIARDASGNTNSCSFNVIVADSESPSIMCPSEAATIVTDPGICTSTGDVSILYSVTDNCAIDSTSNDAPPTLPQGSSPVNVFARDASGNTDSCSFNVIVVDSESPSIQCPTEATTFTTDPGTCASTQDVSTLYSATDNCAIDSTSNDAPPTLPQGSSSVNAVARDPAGNFALCSFNVIVADSESPSIQCPSEAATIETDAGSCSSTQDVSTLYSATDNCAIDSTSNDAPPTLPQGSSSVNVIARDASGNTDSCSFNVIVVDSESPSIQCPTEATTFTTDPGTCASIQDISTLYSATDNCAIGSTSNDAPPTLPQGSSSVNVIARDASGNTDSCSFNVIVADSESPSIQCPTEAATFTTDPGTCASIQDISTLYSATDNCAIDSTSNDAPAALPLGSSSVTAVARDAGGNNNSCSFNVFVADSESPVMMCPSNIITLFTDSSRCVNTENISRFYSATDNCQVQSFSSDAPTSLSKGRTTVNTIAEDSSGNSSACSFEIEVEDNESPVIQCPDIVITLPTDTGVCSSIRAASSYYTATDNCAVKTLTDNSPLVMQKGSYSVTATAIDGSGNSDFCLFDIVVEDREPPIIKCVNDIVVSVFDGIDSVAVEWEDIEISDNCAVISSSTSISSGSEFRIGTTQVEVTASDGVNVSTCRFQVTVQVRAVNAFTAHSIGGDSIISNIENSREESKDESTSSATLLILNLFYLAALLTLCLV